jgi:hypothetical protein
MSPIREWLEICGWTLLSLAICMIFDLGAKFRIETAYVNPSAPLTPTFFSGFSGRHVALAGIGLMMPYILRNHIREISPSFVLVGCLLLIYATLLCRDVARNIRQAIKAARANV